MLPKWKLELKAKYLCNKVSVDHQQKEDLAAVENFIHTNSQ